jgi:hypothetical protein
MKMIVYICYDNSSGEMFVFSSKKARSNFIQEMKDFCIKNGEDFDKEDYYFYDEKVYDTSSLIEEGE